MTNRKVTSKIATPNSSAWRVVSVQISAKNADLVLVLKNMRRKVTVFEPLIQSTLYLISIKSSMKILSSK